MDDLEEREKKSFAGKLISIEPHTFPNRPFRIAEHDAHDPLTLRREQFQVKSIRFTGADASPEGTRADST